MHNTKKLFFKTLKSGEFWLITQNFIGSIIAIWDFVYCVRLGFVNIMIPILFRKNSIWALGINLYESAINGEIFCTCYWFRPMTSCIRCALSLALEWYIHCNTKCWPLARKTRKTFWARVNPSSVFGNNAPIDGNIEKRKERTLCNFLRRFFLIYFREPSPDFRGFLRFCTKSGPSTVWVPTLNLLPSPIPTIPESFRAQPREKVISVLAL